MISKKILAILAGVVIVASGTVGFAVASGVIYLGPSIPKVTITGNGTTDVGISKTFGISVNGTPAYPLYFYWSSGHKVGTGTKFSTSFASPGTYNVSLLVSMDNNHTKTIVTAREIVNPDPTVTINENRNLIDAGQSISFSSSVSGGTGPYSYSWTYSGSSSADPTMQLYSDIGGVYVTVTDAAGYTVNSNVLNPTINSDPFVTAASNTTYTDVGSPVSFSASPYYGTTPYSYSWTWNGNVISKSQSFSYSFDQSGQQYVYVTITDQVGMTSSDSILIEVEKSPTVSISASEQDVPAGTQVGFLANVNNGLGPFSYQWYINGSLVNSGDYGSALYYTFNGAANYVILVTVTDQVGEIATAQITETVT